MAINTRKAKSQTTFIFKLRKINSYNKKISKMAFLDILTTYFVNHKSFDLTFWYAQMHIHTRKMATLYSKNIECTV